MKKIFFVVLILALAASSADARSFKRGICINSISEANLEPGENGISWFYNWGVSCGVSGYEGMEFVPMVWNALDDNKANNIREWVKNNPNTKYLLGYNEPNFTSQANMTPEQAAENWPMVKALADELGLELVAPALNYSTGTYADPTKWMDEFVALVGSDAFDYTAVHSYGGVGVTQTIATNFHDKYGKPVWVTEFCYWPNMGSGAPSVDQQETFMEPMLGWLESTPWIYRYAWFKYDGNANYCLVKGEYDPETLQPIRFYLNELGLYYANLPYTSDENLLVPMKTVVPVSRCNGYGDIIWKTPKEGDTSIEMEAMNGHGYLDFLVEAPADGQYTLSLVAGGYGEPSKFDPTLKVYTVDVDGNEKDVLVDEKTYSGVLPNNDVDHVAIPFTFNLKAGRHTVRIHNKGFVNGMTANGVCFAEGTYVPEVGIETVNVDENAPVEYFNLQGMKVANPLAGNIVIRRQGSQVSKLLVE